MILVDASTFYTPAELAARLSVPITTLAKWRVTGAGPDFVKFGSRVRYSGADVLRWLDRNRRGRGISAGQAAAPALVLQN